LSDERLDIAKVPMPPASAMTKVKARASLSLIVMRMTNFFQDVLTPYSPGMFSKLGLWVFSVSALVLRRLAWNIA
jgi:hypothetical protein